MLLSSPPFLVYVIKEVPIYCRSILIGAFEDLATQLLDSTEILSKNWNILDNVLETLDVQQHSLGVLYVLLAKFNSLQVRSKYLKF